MESNRSGRNEIAQSKYAAVIFDLDGVVTKTAAIHSAAWKALFNCYLIERGARKGKSYPPFDEAVDYPRYIDGMPRYDGVKNFLDSRGIELPYGSPNDPPETETVCGLGNRKNELFHELLKRIGVEVYPSTIDLIKNLRARNFKIAIISSSKNCAAVLQAAGITDLFDVRVDGIDSVRLKLNGKPAPDIFLEAARQLQVPPEKAVVVEDALAGVAAGRSGRFGLVIGIDRDGMGEDLRRSGADWVVSDLAEVRVGPGPRSTQALPSALECWGEIREKTAGRQPAVFLDYDGTLTPIVSRPEDAKMADAMRNTLAELSRKWTVAILSGRDLQDVRELVGVESILYAGSHGFDISGPGLTYRHGLDFLPALDSAEQALARKLKPIDGARVERKKFSIAVHYRLVRPEAEAAVEAAVDGVLAEHAASLRKSGGKKVFELQPKIDWNKGRALLWVLAKTGLDRPDIMPFYIGDDLTDEDAFAVLQDRGIGIVVRDEPRPTRAAYTLENPEEVRRFLERLMLLP